jgi:hypothetical protein
MLRYYATATEAGMGAAVTQAGPSAFARSPRHSESSEGEAGEAEELEQKTEAASV